MLLCLTFLVYREPKTKLDSIVIESTIRVKGKYSVFFEIPHFDKHIVTSECFPRKAYLSDFMSYHALRGSS